MNRHARRSIAAKGTSPTLPDLSQMVATLGSLEEFAQLAERLKPHLETLGELAVKLETTEAALVIAQTENSALKAEIELQRSIFLRLIASGMGVSLEKVLSMETAIQEELLASGSVENPYANTTAREHSIFGPNPREAT